MQKNNQLPRVLLACPVSDYKDYIIWEWLDFIKTLTYPVDYLFVDNSHNPEYHLKIKDAGFNVQYIAPAGRRNQEYMADCHGYIRRHLLENNYDYWFSLECDLFPPVNIIEHFLAMDKPVIGAPYFIDVGPWSVLMLQGHENMRFCKYHDNGHADTIVKNFTQDESFLYINGQVREAFSIGVGCTLIRADILKNHFFRTNKADKVHADCYFYQDINSAGIPVFCDTSLRIRHENKNWKEVYDSEARFGKAKKKS